MDLRNLAADLDRLSAADAVLADTYLRQVFKTASIWLVAGVFAVVGLIELELASHSALSQALGTIPALAISGGINLVFAAGIAVVIALRRPGRDLSLALDVRKSAVTAIERDLASQESCTAAFAASPPYPLSEAMVSSVAAPIVVALVRSLISFLNSSPPKAAAQITETGS